MEKQLLSSFISKEHGYTDTVKCFRIGNRIYAEIESRDQLDNIRDEYTKANSDTHKKELARQYEILAAERNAQYSHQRYFKTLVIHEEL